ncbi:hypothetical protein PVK06_030653 [Gossypium arboreum]|uniref:Uncharacterized protein n=1 Tax=Gossypium arboreum TaxID=29729 RepID=A0ABR0NNV5_GOSAR|nr:hypothetical protein PVK06_030653 [Gossypium arboreum]
MLDLKENPKLLINPIALLSTWIVSLMEDSIKKSIKTQESQYGNFDIAWKALFKFHWPDLVECVKPVDWQQIYWETYMQKKLCTAISMAVGAIAVYDWPESWPDLLPFLLKLIGDQTSMKEGVEKERGCNSTR